MRAKRQSGDVIRAEKRIRRDWAKFEAGSGGMNPEFRLERARLVQGTELTDVYRNGSLFKRVVTRVRKGGRSEQTYMISPGQSKKFDDLFKRALKDPALRWKPGFRAYAHFFERDSRIGKGLAHDVEATKVSARTLERAEKDGRLPEGYRRKYF
mgnify:CR=1 FL=1